MFILQREMHCVKADYYFLLLPFSRSAVSWKSYVMFTYWFVNEREIFALLSVY